MSSGLYARYTSTVTGSDTVRTAKFEIIETLELTNSQGQTSTEFSVGDTLIPGQSNKYTYTVTNRSEVTVKFIISGASKFGELPLTITNQELLLKPGENGQIEFEVSWDMTDKAHLDASYSEKIDLIQITVRTEQVD